MRDTQTALTGSRRTPHIIDLLEMIIRNTKLEIRTVLPARVIDYDGTTQRATVELQISSVIPAGDERKTLPPMKLSGVPVRWPAGNGGASWVTFPLKAGDPGSIVVSDRSLARWLSEGTADAPLLRHTHSLTDAIFEPGGPRPKDEVLPPTDDAALVVESELVKLGMNAQQAAVLGDAFRTLYNGFVDTYNTHTHSAPGGTTGVPTPLAADMTDSHLSSKVVIE